MSNIDFMETHVPFDRLIRSPRNVRRTGRDTAAYRSGIEALAASILAQGLLQNLVVYPTSDGTFAVGAGGRRYDAIGLLVTTGKLDPDWPVRVIVVDETDTTAVSLAENVQRQAMHPADEFDAFHALTTEGWSIDRIADAFGVTPLVVERRLKLAAAAPELIERFRAGDLSTDQMIALCATDDHALQVAVWDRLGGMSWNNSPADLRRAVLAEEVDASHDPRVAFVGGVAAIEAAGGMVRRDLFTVDGQGGFISDVELLERLVGERLESEAEALRAEGWGWVEIWPAFDWTEFHRLGRAPMALGDVPAEDRAELDALRAERDTVDGEVKALHAKTEEYTDEESERVDELYERLEALTQQIDEIEERYTGVAPDMMAVAGAIVTREGDKLRIERGMVKAADRKAVAAIMGKDKTIHGGRETEPAGRKADVVSDALRRSLLGHRNLAVQMTVAQRPDTAKILLACWTVQHIRESLDSSFHVQESVPSDLRITGQTGTRSYHPITDETGAAKANAFRAVCVAAVKALPAASGKLWDALAAMEPAQLDALIAYGVALSVSVDSNHAGLTAKLLEALAFDMADHFDVTAENYLGKVSKGLMIEALTEAKKIKGINDQAALLAKKKGDLAKEAEARLAGSGWVPKGIRTPKPKKQAEKKAPAPKVRKTTPKTRSKAKSTAPLAA